MTRDQFISLFFLALLIFVIWEIFNIFAPFSRALFWSAILAFGFYPLYEKIKIRLAPHETLAAALMTAIIFLLVVPPVIFLILNVTAQAIELYQSATSYVREGKLEDLIEHVRSLGFVRNIEERVLQWEPLKQQTADWILNTSRELGNFTASQVGIITKNVFFVLLNVVLMFFLIFIFLKDGRKIYEFLYRIAPLEENNKRSIFRQINETLSAVIRGQLLTSLTQALVAGTIFWILGLPIPIFFAAATFITSLVPVLGAASVWVPLCIYLVMLQQYVRAAVLFFFGLLVISLIDNLIKPALIGEKTKLPYFLLFFGILGGLKLYGLMGIFLAPVVLSLFFALVKIYQEKYL